LKTQFANVYNRSHERVVGIGADANWATDGHVLMDPDSHVKFMARALLQLGSYIFSQMDPSIKARLDPEKFMQSIEYTNDHGEVISPPSWSGAPENIEPLKCQLLEWITHSELRASIVPGLYSQDWEKVRDQIDEGQLGLPPLTRPQSKTTSQCFFRLNIVALTFSEKINRKKLPSDSSQLQKSQAKSKNLLVDLKYA
jgi:hypothetical protein